MSDDLKKLAAVVRESVTQGCWGERVMALVNAAMAHECKRSTTLADVAELYAALKRSRELLVSFFEGGRPVEATERHMAESDAVLAKYENPLAGRPR